MKEREFHSYRIQRQTKALKDYLQYIKFERNLINLIRERRKTRNIPQKKASIEHSIALKIKSLYKQALDRYPEEIRVWEEYIQFCKQFKFVGEVSPILDKMIQFHGDQADTWQKAVMWEYEESDNMERVKHFMLGGLQRHPESKSLYCTFFKIKLLEACKVNPADDDESSEWNNRLAKAEIIYKSGKDKIRSVDFLVEILEIADGFPVTRNLQQKILSDMKNEFPLNELMWHTLARRELQGRHFNDPIPGEPNSKKCIELCLTVYETACETLKTESMWNYYLNTLVELNLDLMTHESLKKKVLVKAFKDAFQYNMLNEEHFLKFIEILSTDEISVDNQELILQVLQKATVKYPSSSKMWELWMRFHIQSNDPKLLETVFQSAIKNVPQDSSYPLWHLLLLFYQTRPDLTHKICETFAEGVILGGDLTKRLIPQYLEYLTVSKGILNARKKYKELSKSIPACLELHTKMIELEGMQIKPDADALRKCHEMVSQMFGKDGPQIWIDFLKFERDDGEPKRISQVYQRAVNSLNVDLVGDFINQYNLIINGIV